MQKSVIVIAGPTASGKSKLAIDLALAIDGEVVNADSMQVYEDTPVLSAMPSSEDKKKVSHRLYGVFSSLRNGSVVDWLDLAVKEIKELWKKGKVPVVVGGTGLYIDNLINGTTPIPEISKEIKDKVSAMLKEKGVNGLYEELLSVDKEAALRLSENDTTRVRRALEVFYYTGVSISKWHKKKMDKKIDAKFVVVKILPDKEELDKRIDMRLDKMVEMGALEEVEALLKKGLNKNMPAMKALGVPELRAYLDNEISLEEAVLLAKVHTHQYTKRQKTWFKNKLEADIVLDGCYNGEKDVLKNILSVAQYVL